ncbi:seryl-tRNA synthetase [Artomyces pyxidatus]|uniref:Seryl-tRNA synthetase n=1 Tax=Artomyces pyxidatus TaxID=48021 RepID=A0ACB8TIB6_9AGAM|nr:seryl-tRNA synthetase [Artomyces pyxidatus]
MALPVCLRHASRRCRPILTGIRHLSTQNESSSTTLLKPRLDYRGISEDVVYKSHNAFNRKAVMPVGAIQSIERLYREKKELSNALNAKRHAQSLIGDRIRMAAQNPDAKITAREEAKSLKNDVVELEHKLGEVDDELLRLALSVPNDTHPLTPLGPESAAVTLSTHGPAPLPSSPSRDHVSVSHALGLLDLESAATVTGSSWYYLLNEAALLEMALTNYGLSIAIEHGFTPVTTPDVVRSDIAKRCGFQPRDHAVDPPVAQMYHLSGSPEPTSPSSHPELVLAGTAEIPLAGMFANKVFSAQELPRKVAGLGRAFRAEAGARGADTRGLYRVHQFTKLELFVVSEADKSEELMEEMRRIQIRIFEGLGFPFRVLDMPTEELGASAYRKYDMEAWMPGRGSWGEISSTSNCTDFQARRLHIRYRPSTALPASATAQSTQHALPFAHTLNGTAVAVPRLIVALLENGARFNDASDVVGLDLPSVLKQFWLGGDSRNLIRWV